MAVNLSIKNAADEVVRRLRALAERNRRSLQRELLAIIEDAARSEPTATPHEILAEIRRLGLAAAGEATAMIRANRDSRLAPI
jgi:plasmid stability protein